MTDASARQATALAVAALLAAATGGCSVQQKPANASGATTSAAPAAAATRADTTATVATKDGWTVLFDGTNTNAWRGYKQSSMPNGWKIVDGALTRTDSAGDIITKDQWSSFELELEWKISPGGNSGIMYHVTEADPQTYMTGPEFQVLDDEKHPDGKSRLTSAGADYGLYPSEPGHLKPVGQWNAVRIVVRGNHVEHWLNGAKVVSYEIGSADWQAKVKASKFAQWPDYGKSSTGHIALQDHGDLVSYRNIRIRALT